MAKKTRRMTPNQVVAYNLRRAREEKGWSQREAAAELAKHLGAEWSIANFSAAERSVEGRRIRQFTGDEILAIARTFELPVSWFFVPPADAVVAPPEVPTKNAMSPPDVVGLVLPVDALASRIVELEPVLGLPGITVFREIVRQYVVALAQELGDLKRWREDLLGIADFLGAVERQAATAVAEHSMQEWYPGTQEGQASLEPQEERQRWAEGTRGATEYIPPPSGTEEEEGWKG